MKINNKLDFDLIGLMALDMCPFDESEIFQDGYFEYISEFVDMGIFMITHLGFCDGTSDVDFNHMCNEANLHVRRRIELQEAKNKKYFLQGALLGEATILKICVDILKHEIKAA